MAQSPLFSRSPFVPQPLSQLPLGDQLSQQLHPHLPSQAQRLSASALLSSWGSEDGEADEEELRRGLRMAQEEDAQDVRALSETFVVSDEDLDDDAVLASLCAQDDEVRTQATARGAAEVPHGEPYPKLQRVDSAPSILQGAP